MKWFNRKNSKQPNSQLGNVEKGSVPNKNSFNRLLFIMTVFMAAALFMRTGFVQSELVILSQDNWTTENLSSNATLPVEDWAEYSVHDAGVVAGDDLHLESAGYVITQTSDDGAADTCNTENCSTGGGFNGATAVKSGTVIANTGVDANIRLRSTTPSSSEFSQNFLGSYDTSHKAKGVAVSGNYAYVADESSGLHIIDISTPATPVLTGKVAFEDKFSVVQLS